MSGVSLARYFTLGYLISLGLMVVGCSPKEAAAPEPLAEVHYAEPNHFAKMILPAEVPVTELGLEVGRRLFFDPILSRDSSISCASCHIPELAFTDGRRVSTGVGGKIGRRSAMSLVNLGYYHDGFFWDGRAETLEEQILHPVTDTLEMAADLEIVDERLRYHPYYGPNLDRIPAGDERPWVVALAQFQRNLISSNTKYDQVIRGEAQYAPAEQRGFDIFFDVGNGLPTGECAHCHTEPHFTNRAFENNGLDVALSASDFADPGRGGITKVDFERGKFRVPTLRNVALTAPYMHDGRFASLEEVIVHYNEGGHYAANVSPNVHPLGLSEQDRADLIAFLQTLTDTTFVTKEAYKNPFTADNSAELSQNLLH